MLRLFPLSHLAAIHFHFVVPIGPSAAVTHGAGALAHVLGKGAHYSHGAPEVKSERRDRLSSSDGICAFASCETPARRAPQDEDFSVLLQDYLILRSTRRVRLEGRKLLHHALSPRTSPRRAHRARCRGRACGRRSDRRCRRPSRRRRPSSPIACTNRGFGGPYPPPSAP